MFLQCEKSYFTSVFATLGQEQTIVSEDALAINSAGSELALYDRSGNILQVHSNYITFKNVAV